MSKSLYAPWPTTVIISAIAFLGVIGLSRMVELGAWLVTPALILAITTVAVVKARLLGRHRTMPTLVGAVVALVAMVPVFAIPEDGGRHWLPTPGALSDLGGALRDGVSHAATTVAPAPATSGLTALLTMGLVALFLATDYLAVAWRFGATAGLLLLIPWLPAIIFQHQVSMRALLAAIALWLVVLTLTRHRAVAERNPVYGGGLMAIVATLVATVLIAPLVMGGLGWGAMPRFDTPRNLEGATRLNLAVDLRASLTTRSQAPVVVYDTTGARPSALKLYTLTDFDGVQWHREDTTLPTTPAVGGVLWPTPIEGWTDRERTRLEMQVLDLRETNLPLPPGPRQIDIDGPWYYDEERDEVVGDAVTAREARYAVEMDSNPPARADLQDVATGPDPREAGLDRRYLEVPAAIDTERVASLARELTDGETTRHDQAMALQTFLRSTNEFTYDTSVDPTGTDSVSTFLDDREGYCIHFATTMVMMARTLDIPARMGHGFLPGSPTDQDSFVVQGADAHVWPELWFPEHGWVRYEPTPAIQSGSPPAYADPLVTDGAGSGFPAYPIPDFENTDPQEPAPDAGQNVSGRDGAAGPFVPGWAWVTLGAVLVVAAVSVWLWRRRLVTRWVREHGPEGEWKSLRSQLPGHMRWGIDDTPHEAADRVAGHLQASVQLPRADARGAGVTAVSGSHGEGDESVATTVALAVTAINALASAVEDHRYSPAGSEVPTEQLREWVQQVLAGAKVRESVDA